MVGTVINSEHIEDVYQLLAEYKHVRQMIETMVNYPEKIKLEVGPLSVSTHPHHSKVVRLLRSELSVPLLGVVQTYLESVKEELIKFGVVIREVDDENQLD